VLTPDFRILIGSPGASEVKIRLGEGGDTCVDNTGAPGDRSSSLGWNAGTQAPYVLVSSVFEGGAYRVQPGQRVMFQHGSLHEVVDNEKESCGCPPPLKAESNEFPLAASEGLAAQAPPKIVPDAQTGHAVDAAGVLVYNAAAHAPKPAEEVKPAEQQTAPAAKPRKKQGVFTSIGHFFKKIFGAE
jgi:hypothetical protein